MLIPENTVPRFSCAAVLFSLVLFCHPLTSEASADSSSNFNLHELAAGVYVHYGQHVGFDQIGHDDIANIGFIVGEKCVAVIDTGGSVTTGRSLLSAIRKTTTKPICFVINTHIHFDHVLGNLVFGNKQTKFVGHIRLAEEMIGNRPFFLEQFRQELGDDASEDSVVAPDILVDGTMQLDLGNRVLELTAYDSAHSHTDLSVYDRNTETLWLSDLLFSERIPALDGSLKGWLKLMESLKNSPAKLLIPGHGIESPAALSKQQNYLQTLLLQTRTKIAEGLFMEDIIETVGIEEKKNWLLYEQHHKRNVSKAFTELEWE